MSHTPLDQEGVRENARAEINRIGYQIHALIVERAAVIERIRDAKPEGTPPMRPAREAAMLRRRRQAHDGALPFLVIGRIWRELITASTALQGGMSVAVTAPETRRGYWDIARDHFGGLVPLTACASAVSVVRTVADGGATIGVVPEPEDDEAAPWWPLLFGEGKTLPRIVGRLPFFGRSNARSEARSALMIGRVPVAASGNDHSFLAIELAGPLSRGALKTALEKQEIKPRRFFAEAEGFPGRALHLVEVDGFVPADDARLRALGAAMGEKIGRSCLLGSYAVPLNEGDCAAGETGATR